MGYEPNLIAPFTGGGLQLYYKPWIIGNQAFPILEDAYVWRGNVRKREGFKLLGTLPTTPVQGLRTYIVPSTGDEKLIGFSTTKAYQWNDSTKVFDNVSFFQTSGAAISWTGSTDDFFWSCNYANAMWSTNNVDFLRFYNGSTTQGWNNQKPVVNGTNRLDKCLIVLPYKGRLVLLNTQEGGIAFRQRARWSQIGTPYVNAFGGDPAVVAPSPFSIDDNAWRDDIPGKGGFIDADTSERIVSAEIVKDTLIVFFQRSTWRLRYTGNEILPFIWERINNQLGAESTFSNIPFDEIALAFSRYGYIAADTNSVVRIDEKIPDQSFLTETGSTLEGLRRVQGIRDYYRQTAYWTYPDSSTNSATPNRVLSYNYLDQTWSIFKQSFRCFGYYKTTDDTTWANSTDTWENTDDPWQAPYLQDNFPQVVASDVSNGNVYTCYELVQESTDNGTNYNFKISTKRLNPYIAEGYRCRLAYFDLYVTASNGGEVTVQHFVDDEEDMPVLVRTVNTTLSQSAKYVRVYLGAIARFHQIVITLTPTQLADAVKGSERFEMQAMVWWTRREGRIKS